LSPQALRGAGYNQRIWFFAATACTFAQSSGIDLKAMDPGVSACDNFYQYACGTWRASNPVPADKSRWSRFNQLAEQNLAIERTILEAAAASKGTRTPPEQKIGDMYNSCMDDQRHDARGVDPIEAVLGRIRAARTKEELLRQVAGLHKQSVRVLFNFGVRADARNAAEQIASADQGGLTLPDRDYYLKTDPKSVEIRKQFSEHVRRMFALLDQSEKKNGPAATDAAVFSDAVLNIETALAKVSLDRVERRNPNNTYHRLPVADFSKMAPQADLSYYLETLGIPKIVSLNVGSPIFFEGLNHELMQVSVDDLKTYFIWYVLQTNAELLTTAFRKEDFAFNETILRGVKEMPARWKQCVGAVNASLGEALGQKYVEVAFSQSSKERVLKMVAEIEHAMEQDVKAADWMSAGTKEQALAKLKLVANKIGYPEKFRDYSAVTIRPGEYYANVRAARQFEQQRQFAKIGKPVDKTEWGMTPPTVNAYFSPAQNNINFPAGILQPPFYVAKADDAVNYGAIGVVVGHELTHGFDDQGRRFDGAGNLRDWWTEADGKAFETRADCIAQEYGKFSPTDGVTLNGKLTLGENSADNGGLHLAYLALMDSLGGKVLPKHDGFTPQHEFFLGYAQIWCENATDQARRMNAGTDPHSPGEFRVNGVLQNSPEFREAYSCKAGDRMVSTNPCRVW